MLVNGFGIWKLRTMHEAGAPMGGQIRDVVAVERMRPPSTGSEPDTQLMRCLADRWGRSARTARPASRAGSGGSPR